MALNRVLFWGIGLCCQWFVSTANANPSEWFAEFKQNASDQELYQFLYLMPKGGDLHNHLSGSGFGEWWYQLALVQEKNGYRYYTKVAIENCRAYGNNAFARDPYYLLFRNITQRTYDNLNACEKSEYKPLAGLNEQEKSAWVNSIRLDKLHEGRDEFFQTHWGRLNELTDNPYLTAEILVRNMQAFAREGVMYLELQAGPFGFKTASGEDYSPDDVAELWRARLQQKDALATGVTVRLQTSILRFHPAAEASLKRVYRWVHNNPDLWVAVNMVGREDNDKGYPLRFLPTLRELRKTLPGVNLAIHAGEVDEPNHHVRDTLLLGADRIGHGINLISDPETLLLMRHGPYLVEINLISNLLLEYVNDYSQHPFPEYLRTGIPVALSTDDRGMWDSNLTDEFFVAVKEFNLTWGEIQTLHQNSINYAFIDEPTKIQLLKQWQKRTQQFMQGVMKSDRWQTEAVESPRGFICRHYDLCAINL